MSKSYISKICEIRYVKFQHISFEIHVWDKNVKLWKSAIKHVENVKQQTMVWIRNASFHRMYRRTTNINKTTWNSLIYGVRYEYNISILLEKWKNLIYIYNKFTKYYLNSYFTILQYREQITKEYIKINFHRQSEKL